MSDIFDVGRERLRRDLGLGIMHARTDGMTTDADVADYLSGWLSAHVNAAIYHGKSRVQNKVIALFEEHQGCDDYCTLRDDLEALIDGF